MLGIPPLSSLSRSVIVARAAGRRNLDAANRVRFTFTARCTGSGRYAVEGDTVVGATGVIIGGGIAGTLAALPIPLGSLTEPLRPFTLPGPGGMPLTPASWAGDLAGAATRHSSARPAKANLTVIQQPERIGTGCARLIGDDPFSA
jgi:hypothetical protein